MEELVKQYIKNKRRHGYRKGFLERPAQYDYLRANSAKRKPSAPRGARVAARQSKKVAVKKAAAKAKGKAKAKPRKKQVVDDDESMSDEAGPSRGRGGSDEEDEYESPWYVAADQINILTAFLEPVLFCDPFIPFAARSPGHIRACRRSTDILCSAYSHPQWGVF